MYVPKHHEETDLSVLHSLIRTHPLGTWTTLGDGELLVTHLPLLIDASRGEYGTLMGHVARIVGVELRKTLVGKWKVSQNRPDPDKLGVVAGLLAKRDAESSEMAALVNRHVSSGVSG